MKHRCVHVLLCAITLLLAAPVFAQTGKISGKVVDSQSRQALPGVNVVVDGTTLGAATDDDGDYFIINVPPGVYTLQATMIGYSQQSKTDVRVQIDRTVVIDFALGTQALQGEEVTISAEKEIIQMDISGSTTYMAAEEFTTAPVTTVADYLKIQEGIEYNSTGQGKWLSVRGGGMDETDMMVDGQSTMNAMTQTAYMGVSKTAIKEVSIQTGGFNAEYGRARSGIVNIVTRDGSREEYSFALDSKYSFPHLKHFGRNLFDKQSPLYNTLFGSDNFIPGDFSNGTFTPIGDATYGGTRGEVLFSDYTAPQYRGFNYDISTDTYKDGSNVVYTDEERAEFGMERKYAYPTSLNFGGWQSRAQTTVTTPTINDNMYPADMMALSMLQLQGWSYGQDPDYDMDMTITGPLPGDRMNNRVGELLAKSTFMLSYRTQTSQTVFPGARNAYRDKNLQLKVTTTISPQTKLRLNALYGEQYSTAASGGNLAPYGINELTSSGFYENNASGSTIEAITGVDGGGRLGGGMGRSITYLFDEGRNVVSNNYFFQSGAKLTHTVSPQTYFELEYGFTMTNNDNFPMWAADKNTQRYWIFNIDGLTTAAADGSIIPRTFITDNPNDIFPGGVAQILDPSMRQLWTNDNINLSQVPATNKNGRNRVFSTGGAGTWVYTPDLITNWFDELATYENGVALDRRKGPSRLDMARAMQGVAGYETVNLTDPTLLPGTFNQRNFMNVGRLPDLLSPAQGGLINNQTLSNMDLVYGQYYVGGYSNMGTGTDNSDASGKYFMYDNNMQLTLSYATAHTARTTLVSQVSKFHQFKAGMDFTFWRVEGESNRTQGTFSSWNEADRALGQSIWDVRGNPAVGGWGPVRGNGNWQQYYENPFELSAYIQDKIEVQGLIANIGIRMDMFDPTRESIDFSDPWNSTAWNSWDPADAEDPMDLEDLTVKGRVAFKWSPRLGLSFPVTETSKVYFNYGWFYQRPSMSEYYQNQKTTFGPTPTWVTDTNLKWPRTVQAEMGYEQNIKGWFLLHAAGYVKDGSDLISRYEWHALNNLYFRSYKNNNFNDIRGFEFRVDKNYGLFRSRVNYNFMLRTRGLIEGTSADQNVLAQIAIDKENERGQRNIQPEVTPNLRGTFGFFTPRNWGPSVGDHVHPLDQLIINAIYQWNDQGQYLLIANDVRPDLNVWVDRVNKTRTDLRAEKRIGIGRAMNLGLFVQVTNLFDQKYLQGGMGDEYKETFKTLYDPSDPNAKPMKDLEWGEYKNVQLQETIGSFYTEGLIFNDKRDVFYGLSFTYN